MLTVCLLLSYKLYAFSIIILKVETALEDSLDILDERYKKLNDILNTPVFFDSVEVRAVINEIKICHESILTIANKLTIDAGLKGEIEKKDTSNKED